MSEKRSATAEEIKERKQAKVELTMVVVGKFEVENCEVTSEGEMLLVNEKGSFSRGVCENIKQFVVGEVVLCDLATGGKIEILDEENCSHVKNVKKLDGEIKSLNELMQMMRANTSFYDESGSVKDILEKTILYMAPMHDLSSEKQKLFKATLFNIPSLECCDMTSFLPKPLSEGLKLFHNACLDADQWKKSNVKISTREKAFVGVDMFGVELEETPHIRFVTKNVSVIEAGGNSLKALEENAAAIIAKTPEKLNQTFESDEIKLNLEKVQMKFGQDLNQVYGVARSGGYDIMIKNSTFEKLLKMNNIDPVENFKMFKRRRKEIQRQLQGIEILVKIQVYHFKKKNRFTLIIIQ
jgi:hypothetical protein